MVSKHRFWSIISVTTSLVAIAEPTLACGFFEPPPPPSDPPPPPPPTWIKYPNPSNSLSPGTALFGVQLGDPSAPQSGLFIPEAGVTTDCGCGISIFDKTNPQQDTLIPNLDVTGVTFAITNTLTNESAELVDMDGNPIFPMVRNTALDNGLANGDFTPDPTVGSSPISNNASNWFGFSTPVESFIPPTLEANEVFTMLFDIEYDPTAESALQNLGLQFASGSLDQLEEHPITYSTSSAMAMENERVPEPSFILGLFALGTLGVGSTLLRKQKQQKLMSKVS